MQEAIQCHGKRKDKPDKDRGDSGLGERVAAIVAAGSHLAAFDALTTSLHVCSAGIHTHTHAHPHPQYTSITDILRASCVCV